MDKLIYKVFEDEGKMHMKFLSQIIEKSSIIVDIFYNKNTRRKKCNINFLAHKTNGKVKGIYLMRIFKDDKTIISLKYMHRNGYYTNDFSGLLTENNPELYSKLENGILTADMLDEIIAKTIQIINERENYPKISDKINLEIEKTLEENREYTKQKVLKK